MNEIPAAKIKMMQASQRCLVYGLLGLLPVIGLPFGLVALWISGRVRLQERHLWNAAKPQRMMGVGCAALGTILWTVILTITIFRAIMIAQGLG